MAALGWLHIKHPKISGIPFPLWNYEPKLGLALIWGGYRIPDMLGDGDGGLDVGSLTVLFFGLYVLAATQDIAVDGWALTMLRPENVGYASTCNSVGQQTGFLLAFTGFLSLNQWGLVTLAGFMQIFGVIFVVVTVLVALFKNEASEETDESDPGVIEVYQQVWSILKISPVRQLLVVLFTWKVAFAANDAMAGLKVRGLRGLSRRSCGTTHLPVDL